ncbi:MAG TPA: Hsp20/alpha crystallin family protein [Gaiellaceae bacterium]|nr:Hsp20/alpha crystallin family protein [Gaiellaceae bacterium]
MTAETDTEYLVTLDVGRLEACDLSVVVEDHLVTVAGDGVDESVQLPADADVEWLRALYEPGLIVLRAPKLPHVDHDRRTVEIISRS